MSMPRVNKRYSLSFKQKVVSEIERGELTLAEAGRIYDITGKNTLRRWLRELGKNHLIGKVVRVEMADELSKLKQLEKEKQTLESALAQTQLKLLALESLLEAAERHFGVDIKKNFGMKGSASCEKK